MIFDGPPEEAEKPFETVVICLDGTINSSLNWSRAKERAEEAKESGRSILWEMELGLFNDTPFPMTNEMQFKSFGLALAHFSDTLWPSYEEQTKGIILYRGPIDFRSQLPGEKKDLLTSRNICIDYLDHLAHFLPPECTPYALLDATMIDSPAACALLMDRTRFHRLDYGIKNSLISFRGMIWEETRSQVIKGQTYIGYHPPSWNSGIEPVSALCLPFEEPCLQLLEETIDLLVEKKIPFRTTSEEHLITEWDSLDFLVVPAKRISHDLKRKLLGFCAAGGTVVNTSGPPLGLPQEISLIDLEI